jgi:hypothetical protein
MVGCKQEKPAKNPQNGGAAAARVGKAMASARCALCPDGRSPRMRGKTFLLYYVDFYSDLRIYG